MINEQIPPDAPHLNPAKDIIDDMENGLDKLDEGLDSVLELLYILEKLFPNNKYIRRAIDIVVLLKSLIQPLQNSLKSLQLVWDLNDTLYRNLQNDYQKQAAELSSTKADLENAQEQLNTAQEDIASYQQQLAEARQENEALRTENTRLQRDVNLLESEKTQLQDQIDDLQAQINQLQNTNEQLQEERDQALNDSLALRAQLVEEEEAHASDLLLLRQAANIIVGAGNMPGGNRYYGYESQGTDYKITTANSSGSTVVLYTNSRPNAVDSVLLFSTGATATYLASPNMTLFQFSGGMIPLVAPRTIGYILQFCGLIKQRWPGEYFQT